MWMTRERCTALKHAIELDDRQVSKLVVGAWRMQTNRLHRSLTASQYGRRDRCVRQSRYLRKAWSPNARGLLMYGVFSPEGDWV